MFYSRNPQYRDPVGAEGGDDLFPLRTMKVQQSVVHVKQKDVLHDSSSTMASSRSARVQAIYFSFSVMSLS